MSRQQHSYQDESLTGGNMTYEGFLVHTLVASSRAQSANFPDTVRALDELIRMAASNSSAMSIYRIMHM